MTMTYCSASSIHHDISGSTHSGDSFDECMIEEEIYACPRIPPNDNLKPCNCDKIDCDKIISRLHDACAAMDTILVHKNWINECETFTALTNLGNVSEARRARQQKIGGRPRQSDLDLSKRYNAH